jgi:hypothetical protein
MTKGRRKTATTEMGTTYLLYVEGNEQAKEGKVLRSDHMAAGRCLAGKVSR